ncbi:eosinophil granule major basic protein 1-like [Archocentrus centrarchus]|uniref:eosinophil granule major basic protein 1-like n=1 Tax=Archocentrus centrarchus TaxID=63155 RepID=UPI0011EA493D|nr:eosinophil granule major basic protein 1-like [Archocentrus centrarchus]
MKMLILLSLSLAVTLALPALPPGEEQSPVLTKENQRPLLGDVLPVQGHVEVENPAPQVIPPPKEEQEKVVELEAKVKTDGKQEVKAEPEVEVEQAGVVEQDVKVKPEVQVEDKFEEQQEVKAEPEVPGEAEAKMVNTKAGVNPEGEGDQELKDDPEFQVVSEVRVELDQQMEPEPEEKHMLDEENFQEHVRLVADPEEEESFMRKRDNVVDEEPLMQLYEEPETEGQAVLDEEQRSCPGVVLEGKCYEFFNEPMRAADAEFFCQEKFPGGHLASITSQYIHSELMKLILKKNGTHTRTWVGGLRFLETGRFIWVDGSRWEYADWLSGEPNNTANKENCLEVLAYANGKFNDFTCWEPQAFICSYNY